MGNTHKTIIYWFGRIIWNIFWNLSGSTTRKNFLKKNANSPKTEKRPWKNVGQKNKIKTLQTSFKLWNYSFFKAVKYNRRKHFIFLCYHFIFWYTFLAKNVFVWKWCFIRVFSELVGRKPRWENDSLYWLLSHFDVNAILRFVDFIKTLKTFSFDMFHEAKPKLQKKCAADKFRLKTIFYKLDGIFSFFVNKLFAKNYLF